MGGFDTLLDILRKAQGKYPAFGKRVEEAEALGRWELAVGPQIAKHSRALRVEDSVLFVEVDHPIWKSELHHRKRQILELLNLGHSRLGEKPLSAAKDTLKDLFLVDKRPARR